MTEPTSDKMIAHAETMADIALAGLIDDLTTTLVRQREEISQLQAVLEPFSDFAGPLFERNFNASDIVYRIRKADGTVIELKAGAFFKARAALKGGEE